MAAKGYLVPREAPRLCRGYQPRCMGIPESVNAARVQTMAEVGNMLADEMVLQKEIEDITRMRVDEGPQREGFPWFDSAQNR